MPPIKGVATETILPALYGNTATKAAATKKIANGGRLLIVSVVIFLSHKDLAHLFHYQNERHTRNKTEHGLEAPQRLPRVLNVAVENEIHDEQKATCQKQSPENHPNRPRLFL